MIKKSIWFLPIIVSLGLSACGGGSGGGGDSATSSQSSIDRVQAQPVIALGQVQLPAVDGNVVEESTAATLVQQIPLLDSGISLTAVDFGLSTWSPKSITSANGILYVANDSNQATILRYDLNQKKALSPIDAAKISAIGNVWNRLYDLTIHNNRLYTASLSSNRVDIFDLANGEPQFLMSLGTGDWGGDQFNYSIVHALSVAANNQYIFAADTKERINVWSQADINSSNHLKTKKYARLALPTCESIYCDVRLEATDDFLYASFGNGQTYVYDMQSIQQGGTNIQPIKNGNLGVNIFNATDHGQLYAGQTSGKVLGFNTLDLKNSSSILATALESYEKYKLLNDETDYKFIKNKDLVVSNQRLISLANQKILVLPIAHVTAYQSNQSAIPSTLRLPAATQEKRILQDGEPWATLIDANQRSFYIDKILSGRLNKNKLSLQSYSAMAVNDLEIHAKLKDSNQWFILAKLDQLNPFSQVDFNITLLDNSHFALVNGVGSIQLAGLDTLNQYPSDLLDLKITSKSDPHVAKLSSIKAHWNIAFGDYGRNEDASWKRITPVYAREWVIMMTNFAYIFSSPEFEHIWFNYKNVMGDNFFGNQGRVNAEGGYFTAAEYQKYYAEIMNRDRINLGVTSMGGGLGGGSVLGIDTWIFYAHYFNTDVGIIGHEFGHHWGSHDSAWSNSSYGLQPINLQLHQYFQRKQQLPYLDPNLNKFHLTPRAELYNGIDGNLRNPRSDSNVNYLESYFRNHPI